MPSASLYVHVPFCARKCEYCAFYSEPSRGGLIDRYVAALLRELELIPPDSLPRTIFFGGGTPSLLNLKQWEAIFHTMNRRGLTDVTEWTIECNPATVSLEKARLWRDAGVNRVSMGVQSLDETLLDLLGRVHSRSAVFQSFDTLRQAGFANINLDLMFALPGQTLETWRATLVEAIALGSEHLSSYEVIYEEDTPFFERLQEGTFCPDEDLACAMYEELIERAADHGYQQYEIANFARDTAASEAGDATRIPGLPGFACRHNVNYWRGGSYYGLGPSASGFIQGVRTRNRSNTRLYCQELESGQAPLEWQENLPPFQRAGEIAAFGLRMNHGWPFHVFTEATGFDLRAEWNQEMAELTARGWAEQKDDRFHLTGQGLRFADAAGAEFLR